MVFIAPPRKAVCLLSGGLDSSTCLALARRDGYACYALSFDYGQRHRIELDAAARVAAAIGVERHMVVKLGLDAIGGSGLAAGHGGAKGGAAAGMPAGIPLPAPAAAHTDFPSPPA